MSSEDGAGISSARENLQTVVVAEGVIDWQAWIVALPDVEDVDLAGIQHRCDLIE